MTKKKYGIRTVNGNEPDPITGDVNVSVGDSQNLQSVLEVGNFAEDKEIVLNSSTLSPYPINTSAIAGQVQVFGSNTYSGEDQPIGSIMNYYANTYQRNGFNNTFILLPRSDYNTNFYAPDKNGGAYTLATTADIPASSPAKYYRAIISQSDTDAPIVTVLENSANVNFVWKRQAAGQYAAQAEGDSRPCLISYNPGIRGGSTERFSQKSVAFNIGTPSIYINNWVNGVLTDGLFYSQLQLTIYPL